MLRRDTYLWGLKGNMITSGKLPRVLVVDDHADTVTLMARILIGHGHDVECVQTVADARVAAATRKVKC